MSTNRIDPRAIIRALLAELPPCEHTEHPDEVPRDCERAATHRTNARRSGGYCDEHAELRDRGHGTIIALPYAKAVRDAEAYLGDVAPGTGPSIGMCGELPAELSTPCECGGALTDTGAVIETMPHSAETRCTSCGRRGSRKL